MTSWLLAWLVAAPLAALILVRAMHPPRRRTLALVMVSVFVLPMLCPGSGALLFDGSGWRIAAALLAGLPLVPAVHLIREARRLQFHLDLVADPSTREEGLQSLEAWLRRLRGSRKKASVPELALQTARELIRLGRYDEAGRVLGYADRPAALDYYGARRQILRALLALLDGDRAEADARLTPAEACTHAAVRPYLRAMRALLDSLEDGAAEPAPAAPIREPVGAGVQALGRAHALVAAGREEEARAALEAVDGEARDLVRRLARSAPGPASSLAAQLEQPSGPFR
ncbi:MAG TPA: hypothetical protein RMH99_25340 [Sandaracinaceae bacterium LLY-WYZ-13_1]|nr:hypothetical protein [Sandaracinaceae bacterium LLY-WYZ-13_1]